MPGHPGRSVNLPVKERVRDHGLGHSLRVVAIIPAQVQRWVTEAIPKNGGRPVDGTVNRPRVGVDKEFCRVESVAFLRGIRSIDAIAVNLAWPHPRHVTMPDMGRLLPQTDAPTFLAGGWVFEKAEIHRRGILREKGEVRSLTVPRRSQRIGPARPELEASAGHSLVQAHGHSHSGQHSRRSRIFTILPAAPWKPNASREPAPVLGGQVLHH